MANIVIDCGLIWIVVESYLLLTLWMVVIAFLVIVNVFMCGHVCCLTSFITCDRNQDMPPRRGRPPLNPRRGQAANAGDTGGNHVMSPEEIAQLIAQQVAIAMAQHEAGRNSTGGTNGAEGAGGAVGVEGTGAAGGNQGEGSGIVLVPKMVKSPL